jgi:hypothetical protein
LATVQVFPSIARVVRCTNALKRVFICETVQNQSRTLTAIVHPFPKLDWLPVGDGDVSAPGRLRYQVTAPTTGAPHWYVTRHHDGASEPLGFGRTLYGAHVMAEDDWRRKRW